MSAPEFPHIPYHLVQYPENEMLERADACYDLLSNRRSLRFFNDRPVPQALMEKLILTAATAPSGANKQPWTFCLVGNPEIKRQIRQAAEQEEFESYNGRMTAEWLRDLAPLGTDWHKPFLETAPWLIVVFKRNFDYADGEKHKNYYVQESVGIACGFLLAAVHHAGLVALTHTPSPMDFLTKILGRPDNERPFLLIPVGYPAADATVPDIRRKPLAEVCVAYP
ncbi:MAG TPA: nitroreductase family protein [Bacteroidia bacterium]|nr:nitroreductase family protein [Bacteroidia bacterium]